MRDNVDMRYIRCVSELSSSSGGDVVSSAVVVWFSQIRLRRLNFAGNEKNIPLLSYNCDEMQTQALFCAGKARLHSRMP